MNTVGKFLIALTVVTLVTVGCGHNNDQPVPAPPPQYPNPAGYPGGFGIGGAACGAVGGQPLHPDGTPYNAMLQGQYPGGSSSNSLSINMFYLNAMNADNYVQQIVGSGNFSYPDLSLFVPSAGQAIATTFCISSTNPQSGQVNPGTYLNGSIYMVLDGYVQTPYMSPFGGYGYGGGASFGQAMIEVVIGSPNADVAGLVQGRIEGQVEVTLGAGAPGAMTQYYQAQ